MCRSYYKKLFSFLFFVILKKLPETFFSIRFIKCQIITYSFTLLLKPEWFGKGERSSLIQQNKIHFKIRSDQIETCYKFLSKYKRFYKFNMQDYFDCKNSQQVNLIIRIDSFKIVSEYLYIFLTKQNNIIESTKIPNFSNDLVTLLSLISSIGSEWHLYINLKSQKFYFLLYSVKCLNRSLYLSNASIISLLIPYFSKLTKMQAINLKEVQCSLFYNLYQYINLVDISLKIQKTSKYKAQLSSKLINLLLQKIRSRLYQKNNKGHWRVNNQLTTQKALLLIRSLLKNWHHNHANAIKLWDKRRITKNVDNILYLWQKKNNKGDR